MPGAVNSLTRFLASELVARPNALVDSKRVHRPAVSVLAGLQHVGDHLGGRGRERPAQMAVARVVEDAWLAAAACGGGIVGIIGRSPAKARSCVETSGSAVAPSDERSIRSCRMSRL